MANKSKLNELVHKQNLQLPEYDTLPQGDGFICKLKLGEETFESEKIHSRKKAAEDDAASVALHHFTTKNNTITDKISQPVTSTDSLINTQEQSTTFQQEQEELTAVIDNINKVDNKKEIPLNMFYPPSQQGSEKPSEELQDFCGSQGWTEPIYHLKVKSKESTCGVFVNRVLYSFNDTYPSDEEAKQAAAKKVLAMLAARPKESKDTNKAGITVIVPASKRSHPATAKLVELSEKAIPSSKQIPVVSTKHTPVASAEEITLAMSKLTTSTVPDTKPVDDQNTKIKQTATSSGTDTKTSNDRTTDTTQTGSDKNTLQHLCQKRGLIPEYKTEYPPNEVGYITKVIVDGKTFTSIVHSSKKASEADAAREAIKYLTTNSSESKTNSTMPKLLGI